MKGLKRILSVVLCASILATSVQVSVFAETASAVNNEKTTIMGDVDNNGNIDLKDVLAIEKYIVDENENINIKNADINWDGVVDKTDSSLIKDYLAGNIKDLNLDICTVCFDTNGGQKIEPIKIAKGYSIKSNIPNAAKKNAIFAGWKDASGEDFYQADAITEDITLTADYYELKNEEELCIDSFAVTNQETDLSFDVITANSDADSIMANVLLETKDGKEPVDLIVEKNENDTYTISADGGFVPGGTYSLTIGEGINFVDKDEAIRTVNFTIRRDEVDNFVYSSDLIFVKDTEEMKYAIEGQEGLLDMIDIAIFSNDEEKDVLGKFNSTALDLKVGDVICIYEETDPRERDYTNNDYQDDGVAYVKIKAVNGNEYSFTGLSSEDADKVIMMADTIPYMVDELPTGSEGVVDAKDYDANARMLIGKNETPEFKEGDFLVFYTVAADEANENTEAIYAVVTGRMADDVNYKVVSKEYIENYMSMYVSKEVETEELLDAMEEGSTLEKIEEEAVESGFIEEAVPGMLENALEQESVIQSLSENGFTDEDISAIRVMADETEEITEQETYDTEKIDFFIEKTDVYADFMEGTRYNGGVKVVLWFDAVVSINRRDSKKQVHSVKLALNARFEEELSVLLDAQIDDSWGWYAIFPYLEDLDVTANIDIRNYTKASFVVNTYAINTPYDEEVWNAYAEATKSPEVNNILRQYEDLKAEYESLCEDDEDEEDDEEDEKRKEELETKIKELEGYIDTINVGANTLSFEEVWTQLGKESIATTFNEANNALENEADLYVQRLLNKYSDMVKQDSGWIQIVDKKLFEYNYMIHCVNIKVRGDLKIRTKVNIALGSNFDYQYGKRYTFWVKVMDKKAGTGEIDLLDERFGFQFYVMGKFALEAGIKLLAEVSLINSSVASVDLTAEFGPYIDMYGYFIYVYTKTRPMNTNTWYKDEEMCGAFDFEFGMYFISDFKAQALGGTLSYSTNLLNKRWPLLVAKTEEAVYGYANPIDEEEVLNIRDYDENSNTGISMKIPDRYLQMKSIMLRTGEFKQEVHNANEFIIKTSDKRVTVDENGYIWIAPKKDDVYISANINITWKNGKYAFTKYDISYTVPVVWTSLATEELEDRFTASVAVGNIVDGYSIVWSDVYSRIEKFDLPTEEEVLEIIGYDDYMVGDFNAKYSEVNGYMSERTDIALTSDTIFYFDITKRQYEALVTGITMEDGATESRTYNVRFGEIFDFSDLLNTGVCNQVTMEYTMFSGITTSANQDKFDLNMIVDKAYATMYGDKIELVANYVDNTCVATYKFIGIDAPEFSVKFEKGQVPYWEGLYDYVDEYGQEGVVIESISPRITNMDTDVEYTVTCKNTIPAPKYSLEFESNGGTSIKSQNLMEGVLIPRPANPTKTGYTFKGWFFDDKFEKEVKFNEFMPAEDTTIYAKWEANKYKVTLISSISGTDKVVNSFDVAYDSTYGAGMISPEKEAYYYFTGWYTDRTSGEKIDDTTIYNYTNDVTLYARWENKKTIDVQKIIDAQTLQKASYRDEGNEFNFVIPQEYAHLDGFEITYLREGESAYRDKALNAGIYTIKITRPADDYYLALSECKISRIYEVTRINLTNAPVEVFRTGDCVRVGLPNTVKGNGKVTYYCNGVASTTGFFNNVTGSATCYATIAQGTNYNAITLQSITVAHPNNVSKGDWKVALEIKTGSDFNDGTNKKIYAQITYIDGSYSREEYLSDAAGNDFQRGDCDTYNICNIDEPWKIGGYYLNPGNGGFNTRWTVSWVKIHASYGNTKVSYHDNNERDIYEDGVVVSGDFKRVIKYVGNFNTTGKNLWNIKNDSDLIFDYNGLSTDQFYTSYNSFAKNSAPTLTVTASDSQYEKFLDYTSLTGFRVDVNRLKDYVKIHGGSNFTYTVKLSFPTDTTKGTTVFTRNISVNITDYINSLEGVIQSDFVSLMSFDEVDTEAVETKKAVIENVTGDVLEIPVNVEGMDMVWGAWYKLKYNEKVLKPIGYNIGNVFVEDEFTIQKEIDSNIITFLTVNDKLTDENMNGNIITFKFLVLDSDAKHSAYNVNPEIIQAVNVYGKEFKKELPIVNVMKLDTVAPDKNIVNKGETEDDNDKNKADNSENNNGDANSNNNTNNNAINTDISNNVNSDNIHTDAIVNSDTIGGADGDNTDSAIKDDIVNSDNNVDDKDSVITTGAQVTNETFDYTHIIIISLIAMAVLLVCAGIAYVYRKKETE